ncbi:hypothetical protein E2562_004366 [Oryza meyeriana var. granulata]|uniref:Uncharacterized protein n=1 Tax=Oryza meyeriana var. granulata TaxID=110450 RepID=A0A6G1CY77_9ORYZ|nr:hypothetical protein E2562_004366 [Oryza meyeriana var. granulata]
MEGEDTGVTVRGKARTRDPRGTESSYNAAGADVSASGHEPFPSPHETTRPPSPSIDGVLFAKNASRRRAEQTRCTCPNEQLFAGYVARAIWVCCPAR